jgi:isopenicillin-N N-acyltransferase like protein
VDNSKGILHISVTGSPRDIGLAHGRVLRDRIASNWQFYSQVLFRNELDLLKSYGRRYLAAIEAFSGEYGEEIDAIAEGARLSPWKIAALNARTEIYHVLTEDNPINECTAFYLPGSRTLGQNWDWAAQLEPLVVLMEIERKDGHRILQVTEPGIIGKIGFNSEGIGVCLNMLPGRISPIAVPIHILLRSALDGRSVNEIFSHFSNIPLGTYSNILMADDAGGCIDMEYAGTQMAPVDFLTHPPVHANHYLSDLKDLQDRSDDEQYRNSTARYNRGRKLAGNLDEGAAAASLESILRDRDGSAYPICRSYSDTTLIGVPVGTVCSIVMDLPDRAMHIALGNQHGSQYEVFHFSQ